ncbi:MAG: DUF6311 domain-containing protein [Myxococcota bacterium]|nr:DUF6311 domain-containing protein [Myxococcota bacterium]
MAGSSRLSRAWPALAAALVGMAWCVRLIGLETLAPLHTGWTLQGDWAMAQLSQSFFRDAPWGLPLGSAPGFVHPVGVALSSADGIPWLGLLARAVAPLFPRDFQLLGLWLLLCFALQGALGALLTARLSASRWHQWLGGSLFVLVPFLSDRMGHLGLCAHWLLVGMLWLTLGRPSNPAELRRRRWLGLLFVVLSAGVHPYLCAMVLALGLAGNPWRGSLGWVGGYLLVALGVIGLLGYLGSGGSAPGFHHYSANLLALVNPGSQSWLLPGIPVGAGQYEGYGYLGAGVLSLGLGGWIHWRLVHRCGPWAQGWSAAKPLIGVCLLMGVFSLSSAVMLGPWRLISFTTLFNAVLGPLAGTFRAPGRFLWPLGYLAVTGALALVLHGLRVRPRLAAVLLGAAVVLQAVEPRRGPPGEPIPPPAVPPLASALWSLIGEDFDHLVLYPPVMQDGAGHRCGQEGFSRDEAAQLGHLAYLRGLTVNSGYVARLDVPRLEAACSQLEAQLDQGRLDPRSLYLVHERAVPGFLERTREEARCGRVDGRQVCVSAQAAPGFRALLAAVPG